MRIRRVTGIVHRYPDRVLLKLVHVCAVYCRFCFRREMVGRERLPRCRDDAYARCARLHPRAIQIVWEVILTGGDPLMLSPRRLTEIMGDLAGIDHVKIIRLHTRGSGGRSRADRQSRYDCVRCGWRTRRPGSRIHANHPRELSAKCTHGNARGFADAGIPIGQPVRAAARRQ